jgi:hypothetical protein
MAFARDHALPTDVDIGISYVIQDGLAAGGLDDGAGDAGAPGNARRSSGAAAITADDSETHANAECR